MHVGRENRRFPARACHPTAPADLLQLNQNRAKIDLFTGWGNLPDGRSPTHPIEKAPTLVPSVGAFSISTDQPGASVRGYFRP
jgi:hypothetical protein